MFGQGFPEEFLLLFTILIWTLYLLVLISSPRNKINQWCFICGFLLSLGVLKEYICISGLFSGIQISVFDAHYDLNDFFNSIMTAVLYYLSMPCVVILSMYFSRLNKRCPRLFSFLCFLIFLPSLCFTVLYPWAKTREIALENPWAFRIVAVYNLCYGVIATAPILITLYRERKSPQFSQLRVMSVVGLLPLWYWLITLFLFHLLELKSLYKLWQGNAFILLFVFIYYVSHLFMDGMWGLRLNREYFDWTQDSLLLSGNALYIIHMLKGETAKISWCTHSIRELNIPDTQDELAIIDRSVGHINEFIRRTNLYSSEIILVPEPVNIRCLFKDASEKYLEAWDGNIILDIAEESPLLYCDFHHMKEVLQNLISNAIESMNGNGTLTLRYRTVHRIFAMIQVEDTGCGLTKQEISRIFEPFYTRKSDATHLGLGLSYCQKAVSAHHGYMQVKSQTKAPSGTTFSICLPLNSKRKRIRKET